MSHSPEDIAVVALIDHHDEYVRPMHELPEHITILPWMTGYTPQAIYRMGTVLAQTDSIDAVVSHVRSEQGPPLLRGDDLYDLQHALADVALRNGTVYREAGLSSDTPPPISTLLGSRHERKPGERIVIEEVSIVSRVLGGMVVRKNIALGAAGEA